MNSHLVAVEVRIERTADKWRNFNRSAFDQHGLERLNGETVQRRRTVQQDGMLFDNFFEDVPYEVFAFFHRTLGALDVMAFIGFHKTLHDKRFKQFDCHFLGKSALENLQVGTYDDHRTTRIIDTLAEEVLTETPLFSAKQSRKRFQFAVGRSAQRFSSSAVVDQRVDRFLQHPLFVLDDHLGRAEFDHTFQTVVAVDDAAIQIVQVGGSESSAVELNHGTQIGRDHGKYREYHPLGTVAALTERFDDFDTFHRFYALGSRCVFLDNIFGFFAFFFEIDRH